MYHVKVYNGTRCIDSKSFHFGYFVEIGYWLDEMYYNEAGFRVEITFSERG